METKRIGYARVSTTDQDLTAQLAALKEAGCTEIFEEKESGAKSDRPKLAELLKFVRRGDVVVITKLDRLARSTSDLLKIVDTLTEKQVGFKVLNNAALDTTSATGKLMLTVLAGVAEFERQIMLERQLDGIKLAKEAGKYTGRKATAQAQSAEIKSLLESGMTKQAVADRLKIGVASVYRHCK